MKMEIRFAFARQDVIILVLPLSILATDGR